jgi:hypothetical protein
MILRGTKNKKPGNEPANEVQKQRSSQEEPAKSLRGKNIETTEHTSGMQPQKGSQEEPPKTSRDEGEETESEEIEQAIVRNQNDHSEGETPAWNMDSTGMLRYKGQAYVPDDEALKAEILTMNHDDPSAGHLGVSKTLELIQRKYYWQGMRQDVKRWIQTCAICQRTKLRRHRPYGTLAPLPRPRGPWQEITMDFITDLPECQWNGNKYDACLIVVDRYTKMARYIACTKTITASELADLFLRRIVRDFGTPEGIVSDRGPQFTSNFWASLCFYLKIRRNLTTAFHPQGDGQTEVQNKTLEHYLRVFTNYKQDNWVPQLALAEFTYNNSLHSATQETPFRLAYGFNPEIRVNVEDDIPEGKAIAAHERIKALEETRETTSRHWEEAREAQRKYYDKKRKPMTFQIGQKVMLSTRNLQQRRPNKKLSELYLGPLEITGIGSNGLTYKLKLPPTWRIHPVFHVSLLEPYHHRAGVTLEIPPDIIQGQEEWEVESILDHRERKSGRQYLVRWKGYSHADDTWEPVAHLGNAKKSIARYQSNLHTKRRRSQTEEISRPTQTEKKQKTRPRRRRRGT